MHRPILVTLTLTFTFACTSGPAADDEAGTTTSPSTTNATDESTSDESTSTTSDDDPTLSTSSSSSNDDNTSFVGTAEDGAWMGDPCDSFAQDCPEGEKCVPYASSGGTWDALKCVPIQGDQAPGDPCMYSGPVESTDDCDGTSWCWDVDENGNGVCHPFCTGTPDMPECPPTSQCTISGRGVINICIANCDPIIQGCPEGEACYWTGNDFSCVFMAGGIPVGEPCGFVNDCALGSMCVDAAALPTCDGSACCASFCDLELGDSQCAASPGTMCVPFFEQGMAPPEYEHVGLCVLPP